MSKVINAISELEKVKHLNAVVTTTNIGLENTEGKPLSDVAIAIKDNISTKGIKTTGSSLFLKDYVPVFDATVVEKLLDSGATIIAKTSLDELAMGGFGLTASGGPVLNPLDNSRVAGGSSSGSAALVAAKVVDMAVGTDTGDSCRIPASYCGIVGFKPTYGRISRYGVIPYANSLDHVGMFSNNVKNSAILLEQLAGYDSRDMTSLNLPVEKYSELLNMDLSNNKIGVISNVTNAISSKEIMSAFNDLIKKLNAKGFNSVDVKFDEQLFKSQNAMYNIISNAEASSNHANLNGLAFGNRIDGANLEEIITNSRTKNFGFQLKKRFLQGGYCLEMDNIEKTFIQAKKLRRMLVENINSKFNEADFFIAPASARIAPKLDGTNGVDLNSDEHLIANNYMVMDNFTGNPGIVLPMAKIDGMPVGVYVSSKANSEAKLLSLASIIEEIVGEI